MVPATARRGIWAGLALAVVAGAVVYLVLPAPPAPVAEEPSAEEGEGLAPGRKALAAAETRAAAMRRIAAESAGTIDPPSADAPAVAQPPRAATAPEPPEGYAFTTFQEMPSRPMASPPAVITATAAADWLTAGEARQRLVAQAADAGRDWAFGWVRRAATASQGEVERALERHGARILGTAGDLLRARLPSDPARLGEIARLSVVAGVGATPPALKTPAQLAREAAERPPADRVPVFVTLMADDHDGRWRRALEDMGAQVGWFDADTRAYAANVPYGILLALTAADFVQAVEPVGRVEAALHAAAPAMGVDALRTHNAATGLFSGIGGASVPIGVMDTGLNISHVDISSNRRSVCGANFVVVEGGLPRLEDQNLWFDDIGHGTHVTGIFAGSGTADPRRAGMAPLAQDIRFAKVLDLQGGGTAVAWSRGQDWLSRPTACGTQAAVKPLVVNASLGVGDTLWEARSLVERKLDAVVWRARQLYVVAAGNAGDVTYVNQAAAKNVLSVGAVRNNGSIADFSSRGPTADGRLFPQVVATGVAVASARGGGSEREYAIANGTSMASPAVAGVAALIMDTVPALRERPAAARALLMASAVKPDAFFEQRDLAWMLTAGRGRFRLDNGDGPGALQHAYGLGKASARTSVLTRNTEDGWMSGAAEAEVTADSFAYQDIVVPAGAKRLDVVMTWNEPAAETITPSVLNDLDLWIDRDVTCPPDEGACGDRASRSQVDNVEWVILPNPPPGTYRLKAVPRRVFGPAPRAGIAWTVIRGPTTPQLAIAADRSLVTTTPNRAFDVDLTLSVDGYVASGTTLRVDCRTAPDSSACEMVEFIVPHASSATREDGLSRPLAGESSAAVALGEIGAGEQQRVALRFKTRPEAGAFRLHFTASAWNGAAASTSVAVHVGEADSAAPGPAGLPPNDDFANATRLTGERGRAAPVHILLATEDPGEPRLEHYERGLSRSVWYRCTVPTTGLVQLTIAQEHPNDLADDVYLDLYRGDRIVSLQRLALPKLGGGLSFFAEAGTDYVIRLAGTSNMIRDPAPGGPIRYGTSPIQLRWAPGGTPVNDDFADAIALGDAAATEGNNQGATLEPGELVGQDLDLESFFQEGIAASVWYRWTAPTTADWRFQVDRRHLRVLALVGDDVASARLVSGAPARRATFPARAGEEYRIAVVAESALFGGTDYRLAWAAADRDGSPHDDFANAEPIIELPHMSRFDLNSATVEPDEPAETGMRTAWWSWEAPADGEFTWQANTSYIQLRRDSFFGEVVEFLVATSLPMRFAAFGGDSPATLTPLAASRAGTTLTQFTLEASAGERYWFSIGLPRNAALVPVPGTFVAQFRAGPTPENDSLAQALALEGTSGSTGGSNQFATVEHGEKTGAYGDSSLWWTWQPPEADAWYRFVLEQGAGVITVYKRVGAGFDGLELVTVSNGAVGKHEAVFQAEEGARYVVRLGSIFANAGESQYGERGPFELRWEVNGTPVWLRYAGRVAAGAVDDDGVPLQLDNVIGGALNGDGTALYANTMAGLRVFHRDANTGALTLQQALDPVGPTPATVFWDETSRSLVTGSCDGWHRFRQTDDNGAPMLEYTGALDGDLPCAHSWLTHQHHTRTATAATPAPDGRMVYVVQQRSIDAYALDMERGTFAFVDTLGSFPFQDIALHGDGEHMYALGAERLFVLRRDAETGALSLALALRNGDGGGASGPPIAGLESTRMLALDERHQHLFVFSQRGLRTLVFDLRDDPAQPRFLGGVLVQSGGSAPPVSYRRDECYSAQARATITAVDVFCTAFTYTVALGPDSRLRQTELLAPRQRDRFGRAVPRYDSNCLTSCVSTPPRTSSQIGLASPDGKHLYTIYAKPEVAIFERFGSL